MIECEISRKIHILGNTKERPMCRTAVDEHIAEGYKIEEISCGCANASPDKPHAIKRKHVFFSSGIEKQACKMLYEKNGRGTLIGLRNIDTLDIYAVFIPERRKYPKGELEHCFEEAIYFMSFNSIDCVLVHGEIYPLGTHIAHAWVELPVGLIFEPQKGLLLQKDDFCRMFKPSNEIRYSFMDELVLGARTGHCGPWSLEERTAVGVEQKHRIRKLIMDARS